MADLTRSGLTSILRAETRAAHAAAEKAFVRASKADPGCGPALLMTLNRVLGSWLTDAATRLSPEARAGGFADELAAFLAIARGAQPRDADASGAPEGPRLVDDAAIAGAAYAVCGSALGAAALANAWRAECAPEWLAFCAASRTLEGRWPRFGAALDAWGARANDAHRDALAGARCAFAYAGDIVSALAGAGSGHRRVAQPVPSQAENR